MKKILIFSLAYYPHVGGAEIAIKEITDRISPSDIEFHMVTMRFAASEAAVEKIGNVLVHRIGGPRASRLNKFLFQFSAAKVAMSLNSTYHYDATWAMMAHATGVPAALFKLFNKKIPYILTLQEGDPPKYIEKLMRPVWPLFVRAFKSADVVQVISTFLGKWARARGFTGPLEVIPNGVDSSKFQAPQNVIERERMRKEWGVSENDTLLVTSSRLVHKNAVDDCLRALPLLSPTVHLLILGTGPDERMLKDLAAQLQVGDRVHFLGHISHDALPAYLHASDIFIRPSRSEGMGISFVEAMATGIPVIATQEGGISDFLFDAKKNPDKETTGFAVSNDSPKEIAQAVKEITQDAEVTARVVATAQKMVAEKYDWEKIARDMQTKVFSTRVANKKKAPLRVLLAASLYPPDMRGPATFAKQLNDYLTERGMPPVVVRFKEVMSLPTGVRHFVYFLKLVLRGRGSSLVLALDPISVGLPALIAARVLGAKFILRVGGDYAWEQGVQRFDVQEMLDEFVVADTKKYPQPLQLLRNLQSYVGKRADVVVTPSNYLKTIVEKWGVKPERASVVYNASEEGAAISKEEARRELGFDNSPVIFSGGEFVPWKGFRGLIDAVALLQKKMPEVQLVIAGKGPLGDVLREHARAQGLNPEKVFVGQLPREKMRLYMRGSDVCALNTGWEGMSHFLIEAMRSGTPVVTTNIKPNTEICEDKETALLIPYDDVPALSQALEWVLTNKDAAEAMAAASSARAAELFSPAKSMHAWTELLKNAIIH